MNEKFHLGIYALIEKDHHILLVKKSRGPYKDLWDLPGGRPNHGETILQTLQREVAEETSVQLIDATLHSNHVLLVNYTEKDETISLHHTCLIYTAIRFDASHFKPTHFEDVKDAAWIDKRELKNYPLSPVVLYMVR